MLLIHSPSVLPSMRWSFFITTTDMLVVKTIALATARAVDIFVHAIIFNTPFERVRVEAVMADPLAAATAEIVNPAGAAWTELPVIAAPNVTAVRPNENPLRVMFPPGVAWHIPRRTFSGASFGCVRFAPLFIPAAPGKAAQNCIKIRSKIGAWDCKTEREMTHSPNAPIVWLGVRMPHQACP